MGFFDFLKNNDKQNTLTNINPIEIKATKANSMFAENVEKPTTSEYISTYSSADTVFSCVSYASDICSQVDFKFMKSDKGELIPYKNDLLDKWVRQPNPFQSMAEIIYLYIQSYLLTGNSYLTFEKVGKNYESWVLNPSKVKIIPHPKKYIEGYIYDEKIPYKINEIIFFKNASLKSEYYGESFLASLVDPLKIEGYVIEDFKSFYENSLIAQGILSSEYPLSEDQINSLREQFKALYNLKGKARHGFILAPNNLKYQSIRINPKDGLLLESLGISESKIYKVFRMNPSLLGVSSKGNDVSGTELKELKKLYINTFIRPILHRLSRQFENHFQKVLKDDKLRIILDYDNIPEMNTALQERMEDVKSGTSVGLLTYNEGRNILGMPKLEGKFLDDLIAPSYLLGTNPLSLVTGEQLSMSPSNQQPADASRNSNNPDGGK